MHMYICIYINGMLYKYQYHHKTLLKQIIFHKMYKFQANLQINGFTKWIHQIVDTENIIMYVE